MKLCRHFKHNTLTYWFDFCRGLFCQKCYTSFVKIDMMRISPANTCTNFKSSKSHEILKTKLVLSTFNWKQNNPFCQSFQRCVVVKNRKKTLIKRTQLKDLLRLQNRTSRNVGLIEAKEGVLLFHFLLFFFVFRYSNYSPKSPRVTLGKFVCNN